MENFKKNIAPKNTNIDIEEKKLKNNKQSSFKKIFFILLKIILLIPVIIISLIILFFLLQFITGLTNINKPPGCHKNFLPIFGGCFGRNTIKNFKIDKELPSCLIIEPHTCNGDALNISYNCDSPLVINGEIITKKYSYKMSDKNKTEPIRSNRHTYITYVLDKNGNVKRYTPLQKESNDLKVPEIASIGKEGDKLSYQSQNNFYPEEDQFISINGSIESINFNISYTRTKAYCDIDGKKIKYKTKSDNKIQQTQDETTKKIIDNSVDYEVILKNIGEPIRKNSNQYKKTDIFLKNSETKEEIFFLTLPNVYSGHYQSAEYHNNNLYIIHRINYDGYPDKNWTDELWKYDIHGNSTKLYSEKGIDFRVSSDQKIVVIKLSKKIIFLPLENSKQLKEFSIEKLSANEENSPRNPTIKLIAWTNNSESLWGTLQTGPYPVTIFNINKNDKNILKFNIRDLSIGRDWAINSETKDLIYSDYPVFFDVDSAKKFEESGKKVINYIYNLFSEEKKIITVDEARSLKTKWTNNKTIIKQ